MAAAKQGATVSVRILVDEEKDTVVCAEAGNDFVDILFSFLTLPMGTIVRLIRKHQSEIGCLNNLYRSIELVGTANFWTDERKEMLLRPRNPREVNCRDLKVNVDDSEPTKYFLCSDLGCSREESGGLLSNYANARCRCGKLMNREISELGSGSNAYAIGDSKGVFLKGSTTFIVSDKGNAQHTKSSR